MRINSLGLAIVFVLTTSVVCAAQDKKQSAGIKSSSCNRENGLTIVQQQIDLSKTIDDDVRRIAVLLKAADLIWAYEQAKARIVLSDAFELARRDFKAKGDKPTLDGHLVVQHPDQRYAVISAIAKHDSAWARKLTEQVVKDDAEAAKEQNSSDVEQDARTAEKLLSVAAGLIVSDKQAALSIARTSLRYPATYWISMFLYELAAQDSGAADAFYRDALAAYSNAPLDRFLYLALYPFGSSCDVGDLPLTTCYVVPGGFVPSIALQRLFVQTILARAQQVIEGMSQSGPDKRSSDARQIWLALTRVEAQVGRGLPDLMESFRQAKTAAFGLLNQREQASAERATTDEPQKSFDELVDQAEKQVGSARRNGLLVFAVLEHAGTEGLDRVLGVIAEIDDAEIRGRLLDWFYFDRAQDAVKGQQLDLAKTLAAKVTQLDQRAYLYLKIAEESIKTTKNDASAREVLDEVLAATAKAPDTVVKARALLGVAYLYSQIEVSRSIAVLGDAVKCINHLESPDFSSDDVGRRIEGKGFGAYAQMRTPGFNPENGFREIGKYDFDGVLYLANNLSEKSLRALTTLALAEQCLKDQATKPKAPKSPQPQSPNPF